MLYIKDTQQQHVLRGRRHLQIMDVGVLEHGNGWMVLLILPKMQAVLHYARKKQCRDAVTLVTQ